MNELMDGWMDEWKGSCIHFPFLGLLLSVVLITDCVLETPGKFWKIQGWAKAGLELWVHKTQCTLVLLVINYPIISHMNYEPKPTFAHPCIVMLISPPRHYWLGLEKCVWRGSSACWWLERIPGGSESPAVRTTNHHLSPAPFQSHSLCLSCVYILHQIHSLRSASESKSMLSILLFLAHFFWAYFSDWN